MIYLAGPIKEATDGGAIWRSAIKMEFPDKSFYDPLAHIDATDTDVASEQVVKCDKAGIHESNAVLVGYHDVQQIGTPMEVMYAYERDLPIALWVRDDTTIADLSHWYRHHTFPTHDKQQAIDYLERQQ